MKYLLLSILFSISCSFADFAPVNSERKVTLKIGEDDLNGVIQTIQQSKQFGIGGVFPIYNIPYGTTLSQNASNVDVLSHSKIDISSLFPVNMWFFEQSGLLNEFPLPLSISLITDINNIVSIGYKSNGEPSLNFCLNVDVNAAFSKTEIGVLDQFIIDYSNSFFFPAEDLLEETLNSFCFSISDYLGIALPTAGKGAYLNTPQITTDPDNIYIEYELSESAAPDPITYTFDFKTSSDLNADTKANVYVDVEHCNGFVKSFSFESANVGSFLKGETKSFTRSGIDYGPVKKVIVRHDNAGNAPGWKLEDFSFSKKGTTSSTSDEAFSSNINKWLSKSDIGQEGSGNAYWYPVFGGKTNIAVDFDQSKNCDEADVSTSYTFTVNTADWDDAGTSARVFMKLCGFAPQGSAMRCENFDLPAGTFDKGSSKSFTFSNRRDIGSYYSMEIWHDNSGTKPGWRLNSIDVEKVNTANTSSQPSQFRFYQWLAGVEAERHALRYFDQDQKFTFAIKTGTEDYSGTDAKIDAMLCDVENSCTDWLTLDNPALNDYSNGSTTTMEYFSPTKLSTIKTLKFRSDNTGSNPGWYIDDATVTRKDMFAGGIEDVTHFQFNQWLALDWLGLDPETAWENQIAGTSIVSSRNVDAYQITLSVKTSDVDDAGTDAEVMATLKGSKGELKFHLDRNGINDHERNKVSTHVAVRNSDIGTPQSLVLMHNNSGNKPGWHVEYVDVTIDDLSQDGTPTACRVPFNAWIESGVGGAVNTNGWLTLEKSFGDVSFCIESTPSPSVSSGLSFLAKRSSPLSISGTGFGKVEGDVLVKADGVVLPVIAAMQDNLKVQIPTSLTYGVHALEVYVKSQKANGISYVNLVGYAPKILAISNTRIEQGGVLIIRTKDCDSSPANVAVKLGNNIASILSIDGDYIKVQIPETIAVGKYDLSILSGGTANDLSYTYSQIEVIPGGNPVIYSVDPDNVEVGDAMTIYGTKFGDIASMVSVSVGGYAAGILDMASGQIKIQIPNGVKVGTTEIIVTRSGLSSDPFIITIESIPDFMTFDTNPTEWSISAGSVYTDNIIRQGNKGSSLRLATSGYVMLNSPATKSADFGRISHQLSLDVYLPNPPLNQYWYGDISMSIDIPGAGIYSAYLGNAQLNGLPLEKWTTLTFNLDDRVFSGIAGDYSNVVMHISVNTPSSGPNNLRIDNLRFTDNALFRTVFHQIASRNKSVSVPSVLSFDQLSDWSSAAPISLISSPIEQGTGAISIVSSGWTPLVSRNITTKEFPDVGTAISLDLFVPNPQPNPWWVGALSMDISCPNKGIYSYHLGDKDLTHLFTNEYNHIQFSIPNSIQDAFKSNDGVCSITINLNTTQSSGTFYFDNLGFLNAENVSRPSSSSSEV